MPEINTETARYNMVEQQIRTYDVLDERVLDLLRQTSREDYVPELYKNLAYFDMNIPLGHDQVMMTPKMEAKILQELNIGKNDSILEIGTGSGYLTSLLASLGQHVYSMEIIPELKSDAEKVLKANQISNVTLQVADGTAAWPQHVPYDIVVLTGSVPVLAEHYKTSLSLGGRLFAIVGQAPIMEAKLIVRVDDLSWNESSLFETELPPLINVKMPDKFTF